MRSKRNAKLRNYLKAWFHDGEIRRGKSCLRNMDGCTWVILLNFAHFFRFRSEWNWLLRTGEAKFFSRFIFTAHAGFHFVRNVLEKKRSWNQALKLPHAPLHGKHFHGVVHEAGNVENQHPSLQMRLDPPWTRLWNIVLYRLLTQIKRFIRNRSECDIRQK